MAETHTGVLIRVTSQNSTEEDRRRRAQIARNQAERNGRRRKPIRGQTVAQRDLVLMVIGVAAGALIGQSYSFASQAGILLAGLGQQTVWFQAQVLLEMAIIFAVMGLGIVILAIRTMNPKRA